MYKNLYASADSNVKKIIFDLRNKVSQRITINGPDEHIERKRKEKMIIKLKTFDITMSTYIS